MDIVVELVKEKGAVVIVAIIVLAAIKWAIPAMFEYFKNKDEKHREDFMTLIGQHRDDMTSLIASSREERDTFYKNLGLKLDRIHERLDKIGSTITAKQEQKT